MESQAIEWEKICGNHIADKRLVSRIINSQNSLTKKKETWVPKKKENKKTIWYNEQKIWTDTSPSKGNKEQRRIIMKMQIKTTMRMGYT